MGVVRRQSLKHSLVNLTGLIVGGVSVLFLYPHVRPQYGLIQMLLQFGMVGLPIMAMGANTVVFRFFPTFKDPESGNHGFLPLLVSMCLVGLTVVWSLLALFWGPLITKLSQNAPELGAYLWMAFPLSALYVVSVVLSLYSSNYNRIVVPSILLDFSPKILLPVLLGSVWMQWISLQTALWLLLLHAMLVLAGMVTYLKWLGAWSWKPEWTFLTPELRKEMLRFIAFGALGGFALTMAAKSDLLMVGSLSSLDSTGIYAIVSYVAAAIDVPTRSLYSASVAHVTRHIADDNRVELKKLYQKVSINLLVAGLLLFGAVWVSADALFDIFPNGGAMRSGKNILLFIGLSRLVEMATGLNNYLVYYSKYYIYSLFSLGFMAVANVLLNIWLVPQIGIAGAAVAVLCSITGYNVVSLIMVRRLFGMQPFTTNTLKAISLALGAYVLASTIPALDNSLFNLLLHSGVYALLFFSAILLLKVSPDLNEMAALGWSKIKK